MKKLIALTLLALGLIAAPAMAETAAAPAPVAKTNTQQEKMKACAAEYHQKGIAKSEHRKFMSACLKKDYVPGSYSSSAATTAPAAATEATAPAAPVSQKDKMKTCNHDAKEKALKGQERKDFMKSCLSAAH